MIARIKPLRKNHQELLPFLFYRCQRMFMGSLVKRGRRLWAYNFLFRLKYGLKIRERLEFPIIFLLSFMNITPIVLLSYLKLGGQKQGVPLHISWKKKITLALRWVIGSLKERHKRLKLSDLIDELILSLHDRGLAFRKKRRSYMEGDSNRFLIRRFKYRG